MHILDKVKKAMEQGFIYRVDGVKINVNGYNINKDCLVHEADVSLYYNGNPAIQNEKFELTPPSRHYTEAEIKNIFDSKSLVEKKDILELAINNSGPFQNHSQLWHISRAMGYKRTMDGKWTYNK